jgi:hypothetical protein
MNCSVETEENSHQAAEHNEEGTERSHLGSAACCIWAAPAWKAPVSGAQRAARPSTDCNKPKTPTIIVTTIPISSISPNKERRQRSNLRVKNWPRNKRRNSCATLPINIWIASNLRREVSRRGEPLTIEPRHGGGSGDWRLQSRRKRGDESCTQARSGGDERKWCVRSGVVGREVKRLAALGCSLQRQQQPA